MGKTVAEMLDGMSSVEFVHWMGYATLEHFGPLHEDFRAGRIAAATMEPHIDHRRYPRGLVPHDFMPALAAEQVRAAQSRWETMTDEERAAYMDSMFFGAGNTLQ